MTQERIPNTLKLSLVFLSKRFPSFTFGCNEDALHLESRLPACNGDREIIRLLYFFPAVSELASFDLSAGKLTEQLLNDRFCLWLG